MVKGFCRHFTALFLIGLVNNFPSVLIGSGAQIITKHFHEQDFLPLFQLMLSSSAIPMLLINFLYLSSVNSLLRITVVCGAWLTAFAVMYQCMQTNEDWGFPVSLMAALLIGLAQIIGECVNLGFLKAFPSDYIVGFTSGTGFAGIAGAGAWLMCKALALTNSQVFLVFMPLIAFYFIAFWWIYRQGNLNAQVLQYSMIEGNILDSFTYNSQLFEKERNGGDKTEENNIAVTGNENFSVALFKSVWNSVWFLAINLGLVYFLEYSILIGFADRATLKYSNKKSFTKEYAYEIIYVCYQVGVLCSKSSLKFFKVERTWIVTALQSFNFVLWWLESEFLFLTEWGEFGLSVWVGCMGGLVYVNTGYLILNSETIPKEHKEAGMNLALCLNYFGILCSALFCLALDNFIMRK